MVKRFINTCFATWPRTAFVIFMAAFLVRGLYILTLPQGFYFPDTIDYTTAAVNLLERGEFGEAYQRPPIYPVFLAGIYALFGQSVLAVRMAQAVLGACLAVMIAIVAKQIGGIRMGVLAGMLWSVYPLGIFIAGLIYAESVATLLLAAAVLCLVTCMQRKLAAGHVLLGGILFGLAALAKPVVLLTIGALALWLAYWWRPRWYIFVPVFLLGVALPLAPWTIRNYDAYGRLVAVEPYPVKFLPRVDDASTDNETDVKIESILKYPGVFAVHFIKEFGHFWELYPTRLSMSSPSFRERMQEVDQRIVVDKTVAGNKWITLISILSTAPMFVLALIGAGEMIMQKEQRRLLSLFLLVIFSFAVGYAIFIAKTRYRIPIEPYLLVLSAFGLIRLWDRFVGRKETLESSQEDAGAVRCCDLETASSPPHPNLPPPGGKGF